MAVEYRLKILLVRSATCQFKFLRGCCHANRDEVWDWILLLYFLSHKIKLDLLEHFPKNYYFSSVSTFLLIWILQTSIDGRKIQLSDLWRGPLVPKYKTHFSAYTMKFYNYSWGLTWVLVISDSQTPFKFTYKYTTLYIKRIKILTQNIKMQ